MIVHQILVEKSNECNIYLFMAFVDFEKALGIEIFIA